jgi:hypothetical protein
MFYHYEHGIYYRKDRGVMYHIQIRLSGNWKESERAPAMEPNDFDYSYGKRTYKVRYISKHYTFIKLTK